MCGIVGAVAERNVWPILLEGLRRLEYRGYDSAGLAVLDDSGAIGRCRALGKVQALADRVAEAPPLGSTGVAHTRWATHGAPAEHNAHPHMAGDRVALVHNGIIENHSRLREELVAAGCRFESDTDTEVVAHLIGQFLQGGATPAEAFEQALKRLDGAYALAVIFAQEPEHLYCARRGSPLVVGLGVGEHFLASDALALLPVTQRFVFLEEGDRAVVSRDAVRILDAAGRPVERPVRESSLAGDVVEKGGFRHFMLKEIHEQPRAVADTLQGRLLDDRLLPAILGPDADQRLAAVRRVRIVACGTSHHAGLVARYWFEDILRVPCQVEVASEFHYRNPVLEPGTLLVAISQSGETADTLSALRAARLRQPDILVLGVCNAPESSLVRESDLVLMTHAGPEVSVASTKAFSTQLVALGLLLMAVGRATGRMTPDQEARIVGGLNKIPARLADVLEHDEAVRQLAERLVEKHHALFLGRGTMYPIALEGALKLKEISYIHAEGYPAGELKHGPLALIDEDMPVIAVAPQDDLVDKLVSNLEEVAARGAELFVFADERVRIRPHPRMTVLPVTANLGRISAPVIFNIPLQLLAYHVAVLKGTDVDQPRNLAKSVTVE
ncbi:MAG: glutamine--fructose-6-phosphate transaminase (isomerizing) [Halothiobacillaceae bacterium]